MTPDHVGAPTRLRVVRISSNDRHSSPSSPSKVDTAAELFAVGLASASIRRRRHIEEKESSMTCLPSAFGAPVLSQRLLTTFAIRNFARSPRAFPLLTESKRTPHGLNYSQTREEEIGGCRCVPDRCSGDYRSRESRSSTASGKQQGKRLGSPPAQLLQRLAMTNHPEINRALNAAQNEGWPSQQSPRREPVNQTITHDTNLAERLVRHGITRVAVDYFTIGTTDTPMQWTRSHKRNVSKVARDRRHRSPKPLHAQYAMPDRCTMRLPLVSTRVVAGSCTCNVSDPRNGSDSGFCGARPVVHRQGS